MMMRGAEQRAEQRAGENDDAPFIGRLVCGPRAGGDRVVRDMRPGWLEVEEGVRRLSRMAKLSLADPPHC